MQKPIPVVARQRAQHGFTDLSLSLPAPALHALTPVADRFSIESGFFIFTLMPSLRCSLNCPHCYLSLEQRRNSPIMSLDDLERVARNVDAYYQGSRLATQGATLSFYWYGGEPTDMGRPYFDAAAAMLEKVFDPGRGYQTRHTVLTSLVAMDESWFDFFHQHGQHSFQSSYDGGMRGGGYVRKWEKKVRAARAAGLNLSTITVVNRAVLRDGAATTLDYLAELGVVETSWLPFMWNEANNGDPYDTFAPSMAEYSAFMIALTERYLERRRLGLFTPEIGQMRFILAQGERQALANIAGQTLFLLPNGDFVLPDYKNGHQEYMRTFGNGLHQPFADVLASPERRSYLRKQGLRNHNAECLDCPHGGRCVMEFWKTNRAQDDCFGARGYVEWLLDTVASQNLQFDTPVLY